MKNRNQSQTNLFRLVFAGMTGAIICVATIVFVIPLPVGGYVNLGDCFVIIAGYLLGGVYGSLASGIGSGLADLFLGYSVYAPFTFIIKALMATTVYIVMKIVAEHSEKKKFAVMFLASLVAEVIMISGYFLLELCLYGFEGALANVLGNAVQGLFGCVSSVLFYSVLTKTGISHKLKSILCIRQKNI